MMEDKVLEYWNQRASLADKAGSDDVLAKKLEVRAINNQIKDEMQVAEFGCGNGETAIQIYKNKKIKLDCYDFSPLMIQNAIINAKNHGLEEKIKFHVNDIRAESILNCKYDVIYSERMIINLPDWSTQVNAIKYITGNLKTGGRYLMCENSIQGLNNINEFRAMAGLEKIVPPWHNLYINDDLISNLKLDGVRLINVEAFSSTYYFLSRVVNAWLANRAGVQPLYDSPVNHLAMDLPPVGDFSQGKLWVFEKI
jgi:SAM-dependent methyltransferase